MQKYPPFAAVRAFEAAARHSSFKQAAIELGLTPTAISHQIKQLKCISGKALFNRHGKRVELTPDGRQFAKAIRPALETLAAAFSELNTTSNRRSVTLGIGPVVAVRWLVPRLTEFWAAHPLIDLRLHHSPLPVWQRMTGLDLAIAWGNGEWSGFVAEPFLRIEVAPVLAPALMPNELIAITPNDLLSLPLLHHRDHTGWRQWFEAAGVTAPTELPGMVSEDANVLLQAVLSGRGVALGVVPFIKDEIASGRLLQPFPKSVDPGDAYYLVYRAGALENAAVSAVRDWFVNAAVPCQTLSI